ncbi:MAG: hypothetical protein AAGH60_15755 [Pseudomonadota bacterium]
MRASLDKLVQADREWRASMEALGLIIHDTDFGVVLEAPQLGDYFKSVGCGCRGDGHCHFRTLAEATDHQRQVSRLLLSTANDIDAD